LFKIPKIFQLLHSSRRLAVQSSPVDVLLYSPVPSTSCCTVQSSPVDVLLYSPVQSSPPVGHTPRLYCNSEHGYHISFSYCIHTCLNSYLNKCFSNVPQHPQEIFCGHFENFCLFKNWPKNYFVLSPVI